MSDGTLIDIIAEAIWAMPSAKRIVDWRSLDEKVKNLWREDAKRVLAAIQAATP